jgi:hypothetical protein
MNLAHLFARSLPWLAYRWWYTAWRHCEFRMCWQLGFAAGAMDFIPVVGPLVAALVIVCVGFLTAYSRLWTLILILCVLAGALAEVLAVIANTVPPVSADRVVMCI